MTKRALIEMLIGPKLQFEERYYFLNVNFFIVITFSTGYPILYITCALSLFIFYFIDKFLILKVARKPECLDEKIHNRSLLLVPIALAIHSAMAAYFL